jgi:hypothetical protein
MRQTGPVVVLRAIIGLTAWGSLLGLSGVWQRYCERHPDVAERLAPPEPNWLGDEAEEWLRGQDRRTDRTD